MGYLERLECGCLVFGRDAVVDEEDRKVPVLINMGCPYHTTQYKLKYRDQQRPRSEWCKCDEKNPYYPLQFFVDNNQCTCGIKMHHYHCEKCGGVTQIG